MSNGTPPPSFEAYSYDPRTVESLVSLSSDPKDFVLQNSSISYFESFSPIDINPQILPNDHFEFSNESHKIRVTESNLNNESNIPINGYSSAMPENTIGAKLNNNNLGDNLLYNDTLKIHDNFQDDNLNIPQSKDQSETLSKQFSDTLDPSLAVPKPKRGLILTLKAPSLPPVEHSSNVTLKNLNQPTESNSKSRNYREKRSRPSRAKVLADSNVIKSDSLSKSKQLAPTSEWDMSLLLHDESLGIMCKTELAKQSLLHKLDEEAHHKKLSRLQCFIDAQSDNFELQKIFSKLLDRIRNNDKSHRYVVGDDLAASVPCDFLNRKRESFFSAARQKLSKRLRVAEEIRALDVIQSEAAIAGEGDARSALWSQISHSEIPRAARLMTTSLLNHIGILRKIANLCAKEQQKITLRSSKIAKEAAFRARKVVREMLVFWKRNEREERELRKRAEREALEKRRQEEEAREAKRQAKKLHFLITQTELYSHFIAGKGGTPVGPVSSKTPSVTKTTDFADLDDQTIQDEAARIAKKAVDAVKDRLNRFDADSEKFRALAQSSDKDLSTSQSPVQSTAASPVQNKSASIEISSEVPQEETVRQPKMLTVDLKGYQLKGLTWLANLYEQGINGILADEMGLGKTIQAISLMAHLAERHNIWGPFLVVAPASTLHNWTQEIARFVPELHAMPYWGNVRDRQTLRQFWNPKKLYGRNSPFHILVTSYQLVVSDDKHFQRINWQYMILDEAQAIKSSGSTRWKTLLGFKCRNRLLLTGTPIQNSMQELWALLHFIMPSLFDSHDEFSDWFSKDIERNASGSSNTKSTTGFDAHQLQRLHMILKPFMLRRSKAEVQNELGAKVEIDIECDLTPRQRHMYAALKKRVPFLNVMMGENSQQISTESSASIDTLMNLVMQFRKVCNHPELFERADIRSPYQLSDSDLNSDGRRSLLATGNYYVGSAGVGGSHWSEGPLESPITMFVPSLIVDDLLESSRQRRHFLATIVDQNLSQDYQSLSETAKVVTSSLVSNLESPAASISMIDYSLILNPRIFAPKVSATMPRPLGGLYSKELRYPLSLELDSSHSFENISRPSDSSFLYRGDQLLSPKGTLMVENLNSTSCDDIIEPEWERLVSECGKMAALDKLLENLKAGGHRVLLYNQMTRMIDLMEEYLQRRGYRYIRLDGSSKIADRRDLVTDWQTQPDIFVFLLSTRAGGLGINLTAADTVIFYDSDWNPTVDQQAMDRAHRLGQTKQVTVYRLITRGSVEERMRQRAREKDAIHQVVIAGGEFRQMDARPTQKDMLALLAD